jgi:phage shock protein PspC (stress-responsive transcriptional regulator)
MVRRLYRSTTERYIGGVCGGLGEYFNVDPAFVRILFVLLTFASGFGLLAYLVLWVSVRKRPAGTPIDEPIAASADQPIKRDYSPWSRLLPGILLIALGVIFFIHENVYWFDIEDVWEKFWPVTLIAIGLLLVLYKGHSKRESAPKQAPQTEQNGGFSA